LEKSVSRPVSAHEQLFPTVALWAFFLATSLAFSLRDFAGSAMGTASSLFLQNARNFDPGATGLVLSGIFAASAISNPLFGHLSDRRRIRWLTVLLLVSGALIALFPHVPVSWMIPVLLAYGFFFMASYPITEAALMEAVHESVRGRVFGLFLTICGLLANLSHWLVGDWVHKLGPRASAPGSYFPLYAILALMMVASLSALPFLHALRKREEEIAPATEEIIQPVASR
jgi:MFS family permease